MRIGLTRNKDRGFICEIDSRESRCESPVPLSKQIFLVTARVGGGVSRPGGQGSSRPVARGQKFIWCVRNPRNINIFVRVPGPEDRVPSREDR